MASFPHRHRTRLLQRLAALGLALFLSPGAGAQESPVQADPTLVLFQNVRVFDGRGASLSAPTNVLVRGGFIDSVSAGAAAGPNVRVIEGGGRTLMPGLIDAHWHAMMASLPKSVLLTADYGFIYLAAGRQARETLMRGFTSVRDMAGPAFGLKRAIDQGIIDGPRIWPSGAMISQSGGHGDFRFPYEVPRAPDAPLSHAEVSGVGIIADGVDQVLQRTREQLMLGASQVKLAAGGGVSSVYDPIDVSQYTEAEFHAAVEAAENWGTYVAVHAYTPRAIQMAVRAGVKCIEHAQLIDEPTAKLMAEKGTWISLQPFIDNEFANPQPTADGRAKQLQVFAGTDNAYRLAKKYRLKIAWGTDILFDAKNAARQGAILASMDRWYTPAEVLRMATSVNAQLLALSGPRNPYPGKLGVVEPGALADLLLVDGDPIAHLELLADPRNLLVIMKGGQVFKNTLSP